MVQRPRARGRTRAEQRRNTLSGNSRAGVGAQRQDVLADLHTVDIAAGLDAACGRVLDLYEDELAQHFGLVEGLDDQSGAFWDALVDAGGLGAKWERLGRRVRALEASPSLDPGFLASLMRRTLEEPLGGLRGQLEGRLDELAQSLASHALRLDRTEGLAPAVRECGLRLDSWHDRAEEQDRALATLAARVDALQEQAEGGAVAARASFAREADLAARHSALQERVEALAELVGADRAAGQAERAQRQRQLDELLARSEEGRRQLEDVVRQLPVMRAEVTDECRRHAERLVAPIAPQVRNVQAILERRLEDAGSQHEAAKRRLDEVEDRMKEQAQAQAEKGHISESMVTDLDERIQRKLRRQSEDFSDLGTSVAEKFGELVERVTQLQSVFQVHEHALRHHAEEMLNRCTRYDIMMCHEQIGKCVTSGTLQQLKVHLDKVHARQAEWSRQCCAALHREGLAITLRPVDPQEHPAPPEDEHPACGRSAEDRSADAAGSSAESSAEALASATVEDAPSRLGSASSEGSAAPSQDEWARGPERCGLAVSTSSSPPTRPPRCSTTRCDSNWRALRRRWWGSATWRSAR
ncbi:unnamed protein product [Prorocentrum cordatum]|uniref:Uncharacterized protein n=1 Tax=Prorocentrum cordatum TaxID=2364126 RepID=A0ABN9XCM8_9DINO|nr:unnamed protein product [Polarella glacialis]